MKKSCIGILKETSKEEFDKKWKVGHIGGLAENGIIAPVSNTGNPNKVLGTQTPHPPPLL